MNQKNAGNTDIVIKGFLLGIVIQAVLWLLTWIIATKLHGGWMLLALLILGGSLLLIPVIWSSSITDAYPSSGIFVLHGVIQGIFNVFLFLMIEDWGFMPGLTVFLLLGSVITYLITIIQINMTFTEDMPKDTRMKHFLMQSLFAFGIGTIVSLIAAAIIALLGNAKKRK